MQVDTSSRIVIVGITLIITVLLGPTATRAADPAEAKTIGRIVRERPELSSLLQLLEKTGIDSQLSERTTSRYTLFAPTNAAFNKLPDGAVATLLDPRNDDRLEEVFGFHVLVAETPAIFLEKYTTLRMSTGQFLSVDYPDGRIGQAKFTGRVINCSNGIIYLIDAVLTPTTDDLFQRLQKDGRFTIFTRAITASRQGKLFQNMHGLYTTFAPTDEAFKKLPEGVVESLFKPENDERLEDIIKHHIADGIFGAGKVPGGVLSLGVSDVTPLSQFGQQLNFKVRKGKATNDGATITETDIPCANGIIHVIDSVMLPAQRSILDVLRDDERFTTLVGLLEATGLDVPVASSTRFTLFAPVNEAWEVEPYASLAKDPTGKNREALFGVLARHVITGKHVSENPLPYDKLRTIHGAPIYLTRDGGVSRISGIDIQQTDTEAFNRLVNAIGTVIKDPMELPEGDTTPAGATNICPSTAVFSPRAANSATPAVRSGTTSPSRSLPPRRGFRETRFAMCCDNSSSVSSDCSTAI